ncbi:ABC transporter ATP-binding protein [Rhodospirillaceae bacterium SYSU D60014]|uniref:ABC transporter ATP-binding protein n=1 Tax=Virgifigura deserti TaxID=2268457 RepID=UPI000E66932F
MSIVEVDKVSKHYGTVAALENVSLSFADGEFFGLLGPSGSGKTTLLRSIAGFVEPDQGDIRIDGAPVRDTPVHRRDIGMVFQNYALFPHLSVFDNVAFGLSVRGAPRREIAAQVAAMLDLVRLGGLQERRPRELSGGQQQRVALARALITRPRVLLLDEPLGALDKRLRQEMQIELKQIQREVGITTVFVTHDQEEALTLSDRIAIFNEGRVVQVGQPNEVYERPATAFAAAFLGDANFFTGRAGSPNGTGSLGAGAPRRVLLADGDAILTTSPLPADGEPVRLAVRPEKFEIYRSGAGPAAGDAMNRLSGRVLQAIYSGSSITYKVDVRGQEVTVFEQNRSAQPFPPGEAVDLVWAPRHSVPVEP